MTGRRPVPQLSLLFQVPVPRYQPTTYAVVSFVLPLLDCHESNDCLAVVLGKSKGAGFSLVNCVEVLADILEVKKSFAQARVLWESNAIVAKSNLTPKEFLC